MGCKGSKEKTYTEDAEHDTSGARAVVASKLEEAKDANKTTETSSTAGVNGDDGVPNGASEAGNNDSKSEQGSHVQGDGEALYFSTLPPFTQVPDDATARRLFEEAEKNTENPENQQTRQFKSCLQVILPAVVSHDGSWRDLNGAAAALRDHALQPHGNDTDHDEVVSSRQDSAAASSKENEPLVSQAETQNDQHDQEHRSDNTREEQAPEDPSDSSKSAPARSDEAPGDDLEELKTEAAVIAPTDDDEPQPEQDGSLQEAGSQDNLDNDAASASVVTKHSSPADAAESNKEGANSSAAGPFAALPLPREKLDALKDQPHLQRLAAFEQAAQEAGTAQEDWESKAKEAEARAAELARKEFMNDQIAEKLRADMEKKASQPRNVGKPLGQVNRTYATEEERWRNESKPEETQERLQQLKFDFNWS